MELEYSLTHSQNIDSSTKFECNQDNFPTKYKPVSSLPELKDKKTKKSIFPNMDELLSNKPEKKPIFNIIHDCPQANKKEVKQGPKIVLNYSRKEKSLGELSKKFLVMFGKIDECMILLDKVTQQLGVERRRIYDIINILESLGVVYRKGKNNYQWKGLKSIHQTIYKLQKENKIQSEKEEEKVLVESQDEYSDDENDDSNHSFSQKKEKSLGLLSNGFIRLFFSWKQIISLEQAARRLSSNHTENKIKTKIRRLYDIANVFTALGLIKKTCLESKKPAFMWIGLEGLDAFINRLKESKEDTDVFQEKQDIKKEELFLGNESQNSEPKEKSTVMPVKIQSNNSAFKSHENNQPQSPKETKLFESLFFSMFMDFCKQQFMMHANNMNSFTEKKNDTHQESNTNYYLTKNNIGNISSNKKYSSHTENTPKMIKQMSSPSRILENYDYTTPNIRKTVSIIKLDKNEDITPDKKQVFGERNNINENTNILGDKTNLIDTFKRSATYNIGEFEAKTTKKIHLNDENAHPDHFSLKTMNFKRNMNHTMGSHFNEINSNNLLMSIKENKRKFE